MKSFKIILFILMLTVAVVPAVLAAESPQVTLWKEQLKLSEDTLKMSNKQIVALEKLLEGYKSNPLLKSNPSLQKLLETSAVSLDIYKETEKKTQETIALLRKRIDESGASVIKDSKADKEVVKSLGFFRKLRSLMNRLLNLF